MHPFHEYIAKQLVARIAKHHLVVWYDLREEFAPFIAELSGGPKEPRSIFPVSLAGTSAQLAEFDGSFLELRARIEPYVCHDDPLDFVIYVLGREWDRNGSLLMELEKAGGSPDPYRPQLKSLARYALRQWYTDGVIDELLRPEGVSYEDIARASSEGGSTGAPSHLKMLFQGGRGAAILAEWLMQESRDPDILTKDASPELIKLIRSTVGLELSEDTPLAKARAVTLRYLLVNEFRDRLTGPEPARLEGVPQPKTQDERTEVAKLVRGLRERFPSEYAVAADRIEDELGLAKASPAGQPPGSVDTFRFAERTILASGTELIAAKRFEEALSHLDRDPGFWVRHDVGRSLHWDASRQLAELGIAAKAVQDAARKLSGGADAWIAAYTQADGWYRLDQMHRRLEWLASRVEEELDERALGVVRRAYEDACQVMAEGFTRALEGAGWTASGALHQSHVFSEILSSRPRPVAYVLVDAMRFEMGMELAQRLQPPDGQAATVEVHVKPALAALPSITPVGMAALLPGASSSFSVDAQGGELGARIDGAFLCDWPSRRKFLTARVPQLVDLTLDELLGLPRSRLAKKIDNAQVVIVRSQELDHAGEAGFNHQARQVMHTVIENLARALRKLAGAGIEHAVVAADHGHLFASERDESMRIDAPGGETIDLHRRCWIGRGGKTPSGCVRVAAAALGYDSDLEFVFPRGCGVFKAGGDLAFHHGAASLQELLIPVLTIRLPGSRAPQPAAGPVSVTGIPSRVTNRVFSVALQGDMLSAEQVVLPLLIAAGRQVGRVGMVVDGELDRASGTVKLIPGKPLTVAFLLDDDRTPSLRIVIQDPRADAELYRSPADIPVELGT